MLRWERCTQLTEGCVMPFLLVQGENSIARGWSAQRLGWTPGATACTDSEPDGGEPNRRSLW